MRRRIRIAWKGDRIRYVMADVRGPLAVHEDRNNPGQWMVTHVKSGCYLQVYDSRKDALAALKRLRPLADWTVSKDEAGAWPETLLEQIANAL